MFKKVCLTFIFFVLIQAFVYSQQWDGYKLQRWNTHIHTSYSKESWYKLYDLNQAIFTKGGSLDHMTAKNPQQTLQICQKLNVHPIFTDHCFKLSKEEFENTCKIVNKSKFLCLMGFELTWLGDNHMNVINCTKLVTTNEQNKNPGIKVLHNLDEFSQWLADTKDNIIIQLNHPLYTENNYNNYFSLIPNEKICLMEVNTNIPFIRSVYYNLPLYFKALSRGLKVAPTIGHDNFGAPDEKTRKNHTGIWVKSIDREGVFEALKSRRIFASEIKDFVLTFSAKTKNSNKWYKMGDSIYESSDCFEINAILSSKKQLGLVSLLEITNDKNQILSQKICNTNMIDWREIIYPTKDAICLLIIVKDIDKNMVVSAPIWIKVDQAEITPIENAPNATDEELKPYPINYKLAKKYNFKTLNINNIIYDRVNNQILIYTSGPKFTIFDQCDNLIANITPNKNGTITSEVLHVDRIQYTQDPDKYYDLNNLLNIASDAGYYYAITYGPGFRLEKNMSGSEIYILSKFVIKENKINIITRKQIFKNEATIVNAISGANEMIVIDNLLYFICKGYLQIYDNNNDKIIKTIKLPEEFHYMQKDKYNNLYIKCRNYFKDYHQIIKYDKNLENPQIIFQYKTDQKNKPYDKIIDNFYIDNENNLYLRYLTSGWDKFSLIDGKYQHVYRCSIESSAYRNSIVVTKDGSVYVHDSKSNESNVYKYIPIYK